MNGPTAGPPHVAVAPDCWRRPALVDAVVAGGGRVVEPPEAEALVWAEPAAPELLPGVLAQGPGIDWVQLPYAGIENLIHLLDDQHRWTCGKGVYAEPVAEHVLMMALAGLRGMGSYARAQSWLPPQGRNLLGARVTVLGGGGITESLVRLLAPWDCHVTVLRRHPVSMNGVDRVVGPDRLHDALGDADVVVVALALTPETTGIIDAAALGAMAPPRVVDQRGARRPCGHRRPGGRPGGRVHRGCRPGRDRPRTPPPTATGCGPWTTA